MKREDVKIPLGENNYLILKQAILSPNGVFKYIQINITDQSSNEKWTIVRGWNSEEFHAENLRKFTEDEL